MSKEKKSENVKYERYERPKKPRDFWMLISGILLIVLLVVLFIPKNQIPKEEANQISIEEAGQTSLDYLRANLIPPGVTVEILEMEDLPCLYKIKMKFMSQSGSQETELYVTKDGGMLFPGGLDLTGEFTLSTQPEISTPQTDKPKVELFIMSHCPYGTQMEKGFLPVVDLLGDKIDAEIKFVNYVMHGEKEVNEQLLQYCIQKELNNFYDYMGCFLKEGDTDSCLIETGITRAELQTCIDTTDTEFEITKNLNDQASWLSGRFPKFNIHDAENKKYGIKGSPGFVLNGVKINLARDPNSILKSVCQSFTDAPEECDQELSTQIPSPGFGLGSGGASSGECG